MSSNLDLRSILFLLSSYAILHPTKSLLFDLLCIAITYCKYLPYCETVRCSVAVSKTMQGYETKNTGVLEKNSAL